MHDLDFELQKLTADWQNKKLSGEDFEKKKNKLVAEVLYSLTRTRTQTLTQTLALALTCP